MQRRITSLQFVNIKCDNFLILLQVGSFSLIISDQEAERIWKILALEKLLPDVGFKI